MKERIFAVYGKAGVLLILLLMIVILTCAAPAFIMPQNLINIVRQVTFYAIVGFGGMITLIGGDFDLSPGSVMALASILGTMTVTGTDRGPLLPFTAALLVGIVVGSLNGYLVAYLQMPAFIATLGTQTLVRGLALYIAEGQPIRDLPESFTNIGSGSVGMIPIPVIFLIVLGIITWYIMKWTKLGRHIYAVGGNATAAVVSGVNAKYVKYFTYVFSSVVAALAGILLTARVGAGNASLGEGYEMKAITGCVIGGVSLKGGIGSMYGMICDDLRYTCCGGLGKWNGSVEYFRVFAADCRRNHSDSCSTSGCRAFKSSEVGLAAGRLTRGIPYNSIRNCYKITCE